MSWTFVACVGIAFAWMALFYLWGRGFLTWIKAERDIASCIPFGYLVFQVVYQIIYLLFYFTRGSYRMTVYIWFGVVAVGSILLIKYLQKHSNGQKHGSKIREKAGICVAALAVIGLALYIALHVPYYGADTVTYINTMNESYYRDSIWVESGLLKFHFGMSSMYQLHTIPSILTGIKPYYISLFTVRIVGICLFSLIVYQMGLVVFRQNKEGFSWPSVILAVIVPYLLMFWGSNYTAEFFYWRINEAKGYCQFVLLPIGFSVFLSMFQNNADRKILWKKQFLVGLSAVPVSASSLSAYLFLLLMGLAALLAYDRMKSVLNTIGRIVICALPNLVYLILYFMEKQGIIVL